MVVVWISSVLGTSKKFGNSMVLIKYEISNMKFLVLFLINTLLKI